MANLLTPNFPPILLPGTESWTDTFLSSLSRAKKVEVCSGYASEDALDELLLLLQTKQNSSKPLVEFTFVLGMAFFDGLTSRQLFALENLDRFLKRQKIGAVRIPLAIKVHSKVASFEDFAGEKWATVGSSNLTAIVNGRQAELDVLLELGDKALTEIALFFSRLVDSSQPLSAAVLQAIPVVKKQNSRLAQSEGVSLYPVAQIELDSSKGEFHIPIKTEPRSNVNKFNAAPRGRIPRSWWEVEFIIPSTIQVLPNFPKKPENNQYFTVITDDGFSFGCHVSGGSAPNFNKNFESTGNLKILGYWIKGRLLDAGVLSEGELITDLVLEKYGRKFVTMTKLKGKDIWSIDFKRP